MGNRNAGTQGESMGCEGRGKRIAIVTFGCQMNVRDGEIILGMLRQRGYVQAGSVEEADIVIFNTCSVRQHAEDKVWSELGRYDHRKRFKGQSRSGTVPYLSRGDTRPYKKIIGLVGCMAQNYQGQIFRRFPGVDLVCGPANIYDIPHLLERVLKERKQLLAVDRVRRPLNRRDKPLHCDCGDFRADKLKAFVSIMYGCNNFCSYCIVPYVRGRERSRPLKHIVDEVKVLAGGGCKEIALLGQNVNSYGRDLRGKIDFVRLLERIDTIEGIERIRFVTSHPKDASVKMFKAMRSLSKVCEHLHLPLQAGSDKILRLMNRGYSLDRYLRLIDYLRRIVPESSLTTDIIVGFPGETKSDFKKTSRAMKRIQFDQAFIFKYSPRPKTKAAGLKDDVPLEIKQQRNQLLLKLQGEISIKKNRGLLGKSIEVLTEKTGRSFAGDLAGDVLQGRSRSNKITLFSGKKELISKLVNVRINRITAHTLIGEVK